MYVQVEMRLIKLSTLKNIIHKKKKNLRTLKRLSTIYVQGEIWLSSNINLKVRPNLIESKHILYI